MAAISFELPRRITAAWLNGLSLADRADFLQGDWSRQMHAWASSHTTFFRWARRTLIGTRSVSNASVFFLDLGDKLFAVTAAHVYEGYLADKAKSPHILCHIGNVLFDPETRLIGVGSGTGIDIATFSITRDELRAVGKQAVLGSAWPPPMPTPGQAAYLSGFPGKLRLWVGWNEISFAMHSGLGPIDRVNDQFLTCVFERDYWVGTAGERLPPELPDVGGLSGGPVLLPLEADGAWHLTLGGVISDGVFGLVVNATRADFISADGTIREPSAR